ncbi:hypothetical protein K3217_28080 [bacterium BD-1]|nr:hypothetical protein [Ottowia caeni]
MPAALEIPTTLAHARGAYTATARLGEHGEPAQLILDTGSSSMVVRPKAYDPGRDGCLRATPWLQEVRYGGGAWAGPVLRSRLAFGHGHHQRRIDDALFAWCETDDRLFQGADGLWGLAYRSLDPARDASALLAAQGHAPPLSWPWPYDRGHAFDLDAFDAFLHTLPRTLLTPAFSALEEEGVVRNRFALAAGRAVVHVAEANASTARLEADPLNRGTLVLGGGSEHQHLYRGAFQDVRVVHDEYYEVNLRALRVGQGDPIPVAPAAAAADGARGNALLDTGCSLLMFDAATHEALVAALARIDPAFPAWIERSRQALAEGHGLPSDAIDLQRWPDLHLVLEAPGGGETHLRLPASQAWARNAPAPGECLCLLAPPPPSFRGRSLLGLPVFAGRYAVFDRGAGQGLGSVRFATARDTA